jgi:transcription initiation factor TFIID subunit 1
MSEAADHSTEEEDSEEEKEDGREDEVGEGGGQGGLLTSFLFGNIDRSGRLESGFLDLATRRQLGSLGNMLADTTLSSVRDEVKEDVKVEVGETDEAEEELEEVDYNQKADGAEDYSLISEMLDVDTSEDEEDSEDGEEQESVEPEVGDEAPTAPKPVPAGTGAPKEADTALMPPPPPSPLAPARPPPSVPATLGDPGVAPLAGMLPERYRNVDVKDFFPEFKENAVLRFSSLFPIKESHKPRIWKSLRKRRLKERGGAEDEPRPKARRQNGPGPHYGPLEPGMAEQCDSVRFHRPQAVKREAPGGGPGGPAKITEKKGPKPTDWR